MAPFSRRDVLVGGSAAGAALWVLGSCGTDESDPNPPNADAPTGGADGPVPGGADARPRLDATPQCDEGPTEDQIEGPFYTEGAPERSVLVEGGDAGVRLSLEGLVVSTDCTALAGALLDLWHADADGAYDTAGFRFRGKLFADASGAYRFETIIPGRYLNGATYRPAHLHLKVSAAGHVLLTTQLYFEGDPFNDSDPFLHPSLVMPLEDDGAGGKRAVFDFVLAPT